MRLFRALAFTVFLPLSQLSQAQVTIADAGPDQYLCDDNAFLQGNAVAFGETGVWTIVSGIGTITDPSDPDSQISGPAGSVIVLRWTISDGTNMTSDDVAIWLYDGDAPWASAGADQVLFIPQSSAQLQGSPYTFPMTCVWTIVVGAGVISDPADPYASYTGAGVGQNILVWSCDNGPCGVSSDEVVITVEEAMALGRVHAMEGVRVFFDAMTERLSVTASENIGRLDITDQMGRLVLDRSTNARSATLDVSALSIGAYTVRAMLGDTPFTGRFVVVR